MTFTTPLPEQKPWLEMSDAERDAYFAYCCAHQPIDREEFNDALKAKREAARHAETASTPPEIPAIAEQGGERQNAVAGRIGGPISEKTPEIRLFQPFRQKSEKEPQAKRGVPAHEETSGQHAAR